MRDLFGTCFRPPSLTNSYRGFVPAVVVALAQCSTALAVPSGSVSTTIYVGRYFEVRDHDQPTKYVFNGSTRVADITGSLSTDLRVQRFRLYSGWNLCSLAVTGPLSASTTGSQGEVLSVAFKWNVTAQSWLPVTNNETLSAGTVLWLKAKTNASLAVLGTYSQPQAGQVQPGGMYLSGTGLEAWSPAFPSEVSAWLYDSITKQWSERLAGDLAFVSDQLLTVEPGQALYVKANTTMDLAIPDSSLRVRYYHQDHLGSSSVITDAAGALVEETAYFASGVPRNQYQPRGIDEPYGFVQKERDNESGLDYFEARYVAAALGRFVAVDPKYASPDTLSQGDLASFLFNPQQLNSYAYAGNNPVRYVDHTGLDSGEASAAGGTAQNWSQGQQAVEWAAGNAGTASDVVETALMIADKDVPASKAGGAFLSGVSVGVKAVKFAQNPTSRNGAELGWTVSKGAISVACAPVAVGIAIAEYAGVDVAGGLEWTGRKISPYLFDSVDFVQLAKDQKYDRDYQAVVAKTQRWRAYIEATKKGNESLEMASQMYYSLGKYDDYNRVQQQIQLNKQSMASSEESIRLVWRAFKAEHKL